MLGAKPVGFPMATTTSLSTFGESYEDPTLYKNTISALQYLYITRPGFSITMNKLSLFLQ